MNGPIRRLAIGLFGAMGLLVAAVSWFQVVRADQLTLDPRNPRPALSERGKERGLITTADGTVVARSAQEEGSREFLREYPFGPEYAHVVGYSSFLVGETGLEAAYDSELRSRRDLTISDVISVILGRDLDPLNLEVTIDSELQTAAHDALGANNGAVVALDPKTGAVLAAVSAPSFDPNLLLTDNADDQWETLLLDPKEPLKDRSSREIYAPGSTFKTVVAATGLDVGAVEPGSVYPDSAEFPLPGSTATISNLDGRVCNDGKTVTLLQAFVQSCNTTFAALAIQLGAIEVGVTSDALGFNRDIEYEWTVPQANWPTAALVDDDAALGQSGIGERDVRATPLHMAMVASAIANNGVTTRPYLVQRLFDSGGNTVSQTEVVEFDAAMTPETASVMAQMMERVVTEGTGRRGAVPGVRVAGKTGTATGTDGFPNPWFIGFAPVDNPGIALAVLIEGSPVSGESATGGSLAAPIASRLIETWLMSRSSVAFGPP